VRNLTYKWEGLLVVVVMYPIYLNAEWVEIWYDEMDEDFIDLAYAFQSVNISIEKRPLCMPVVLQIQRRFLSN
jgi:hypothetical protein